jgi:hypothetical protein
MGLEEHIHEILNSGLALGHMFQDILETHGMQDKEARVAARSLAAAVSQQFKTLGDTFTQNGHVECAKALWFEAANLFAAN